MNGATLDEQVQMTADLVEHGDITAVTGVAILHGATGGLDRMTCLRLIQGDLARRDREDQDAERAMREDGWW